MSVGEFSRVREEEEAKLAFGLKVLFFLSVLRICLHRGILRGKKK